MRGLALIVMAFALGGCVDYAARQESLLASLVGQPEVNAVQALGVPTRTYETNGVKFLAYDNRHYDVIPDEGPFFAAPGFFGGGFLDGGFGGFYSGGYPDIVRVGCETTLEVAGGRVRAWTLRGSFCGYGQDLIGQGGTHPSV